MKHYTYLLIDPDSEMMYIGVRSYNGNPEKDPYMGSSTVMTTKDKRRCDKIILKTFKTRKEASNHEIELHELYDVVRNEVFWNQYKATSTRFNLRGLKRGSFSDLHIEKLCKAQQKRWAEGRGPKFPKGENHPSRKYSSVYLWKNIDGSIFKGTNLEFQKYTSANHIQNITKLIKGDRVQLNGWYITENLSSGCITTSSLYVDQYIWHNSEKEFVGTGKQLSDYLSLGALSTVNKVLRGNRKTVNGWYKEALS